MCCSLASILYLRSDHPINSGRCQDLTWRASPRCSPLWEPFQNALCSRSNPMSTPSRSPQPGTETAPWTADGSIFSAGQITLYRCWSGLSVAIRQSDETPWRWCSNSRRSMYYCCEDIGTSPLEKTAVDSSAAAFGSRGIPSAWPSTLSPTVPILRWIHCCFRRFKIIDWPRRSCAMSPEGISQPRFCIKAGNWNSSFH